MNEEDDFLKKAIWNQAKHVFGKIKYKKEMLNPFQSVRLLRVLYLMKVDFLFFLFEEIPF